MRYVFVAFTLALSSCVSAYKADLIIFSFDRPLQLWALLESIEKNMHNLGEVKVLYRASSEEYNAAYQEVKNTFDAVEYIQQSHNRAKQEFKSLTMQCLYDCPHDHVFFAVDDMIVVRSCDLDECIAVLEETNSYAFYLRLGMHLTSCYAERSVMPLPSGKIYKDRFFMWHFGRGSGDWKYPHSVDMCIFKKYDVIDYFQNLSFDTPNILESQWAGVAWQNGTFKKRGICYTETMVINIPLNRVQTNYVNPCMNYMTPDQLLAEFNSGKKMDINPLQGIYNTSAHMEYEPVFVDRY